MSGLICSGSNNSCEVGVTQLFDEKSADLHSKIFDNVLTELLLTLLKIQTKPIFRLPDFTTLVEI